ncbi:YqaJ viral recombinase family nuclease [Ancylobacter amanitiformis]|uniref:Phage-related endonuclease n=1 Tax=Ancylobacter amanitiformis TaxID=217069 RepID=A0ABU0LQF6_9HYPH|nr:YqaJ viral recombinase family protein [Ancylobacter amanitiformis]MDQ0510932.1 putative phage-related endonuclease [Ancylobacter amanitiformis]
MVIERIQFSSRDEWLDLRKNDITASVVGALFGVHDYQTPFGLYALKTGLTAEDPEETDAMKRGRLLEPVAVQLLREQHPEWKITHNTGRGAAYLRDASVNLGATVDVFVECPVRGLGVVQVKSVEAGTFRRKWVDAETHETTPPLWIVLQTLTEAHLAGAAWGAVAPLVVSYGIDMPLIDIPIHQEMIKRIRGQVRNFWTMVEEDQEPDADFSKDAALIQRLYTQDDGSSVDLSGNRIVQILAEREKLKEVERAGASAEKARKTIDTEIINMLGNATTGRMSDGTEVTAKTTHRKGYEVKPSSYRSVKVKAGAVTAPADIDEF